MIGKGSKSSLTCVVWLHMILLSQQMFQDPGLGPAYSNVHVVLFHLIWSHQTVTDKSAQQQVQEQIQDLKQDQE